MTADREAAAAGETGGEQATGENIEQDDETSKPMDEDKMVEPTDKDDKVTESARRKPRSTPSISRMKEERRRAKITEQE